MGMVTSFRKYFNGLWQYIYLVGPFFLGPLFSVVIGEGRGLASTSVTDLDNAESFLSSSTHNEAFTWKTYSQACVGLYRMSIPYTYILMAN